MTLHNWFWISMFRCTGNRLPISCNQLHHFEINWNVANSVENFWNLTLPLVINYRKLVIDYQRVKTLVTLKILRKTLLKNKTVLCLFFEKSFQYFPCEVFLISSLESWIHLLLNLEIKLLLILESSWFLLMKLEIKLDLELVDSILKSFFGLFVIIFVIIKTTWINLIHHLEACFYSNFQFPENV